MSHASSSSSPPIPSLASKPPASRTAERRTIAPQAMNESSGWPGWPGAAGSGLWAISTHVGSSRSPRPTTTWALISPSRASASRSVAAWASAPGAYHESSSASATYGVVAAAMPSLRAAPPPLVRRRITRTSGNAASTASALPSEDASSTRITSGRSGSAWWYGREASNRSRRSREAITIVTSDGIFALPPPIGAAAPRLVATLTATTRSSPPGPTTRRPCRRASPPGSAGAPRPSRRRPASGGRARAARRPRRRSASSAPRRVAAVALRHVRGHRLHAARHRPREAVDGGTLAEDRLKVGRRDGARLERPQALAEHQRAHERLRHRHLLVEHEADEQRERVVGDQGVRLVGVGEVQAVGHGADATPSSRRGGGGSGRPRRATRRPRARPGGR